MGSRQEAAYACDFTPVASHRESFGLQVAHGAQHRKVVVVDEFGGGLLRMYSRQASQRQ